MKLSAHFTLEEFTRSARASQHGIPNEPPRESLPAIQRLVVAVLEPARVRFGRPIRVNSGFRSPELNEIVGGEPDSQHVWTADRAAADVVMPGFDTRQLARWIADNCDFDQVICEEHMPAEGLDSGWVHVSTRTDGPNRRELWTKERGQRGYKPGLPS